MAKAVLKKTSGGTVNVPDLDLAQVQKIKEISPTQVWFLETTNTNGVTVRTEYLGPEPKRI